MTDDEWGRSFNTMQSHADYESFAKWLQDTQGEDPDSMYSGTLLMVWAAFLHGRASAGKSDRVDPTPPN